MGRKTRVLVAKPGLVGHDREDFIISQALRNHGMRVIYAGLSQTPVQIAEAAVQEDVDIILLFSLSGAHKTMFPKIIEALKEREASDIPVVGGGVIPDKDVAFLIEKGMKKVFTRDASTDVLARHIQDLTDQSKTPVEAPKKIAHIGIAVNSIDDVLSFYTESLGLRLENVENVNSEGVKVAFLKIGESRIELLEPFNESSSIQSFLNKKGEGLHHIALEVDNIDGRLKQLQSEGIKLINDEPKRGSHDSQIAFIHPKSANGVLFELSEHPEEKN